MRFKPQIHCLVSWGLSSDSLFAIMRFVAQIYCSASWGVYFRFTVWHYEDYTSNSLFGIMRFVSDSLFGIMRFVPQIHCLASWDLYLRFTVWQHDVYISDLLFGIMRFAFQKKQSDLGTYCLQFRLPKYKCRWQIRRHVTNGRKRVKFAFEGCSRQQICEIPFFL